MSAGLLLLIGLIVLLLVGASALFSAIETSLFSLQPTQIERLRGQKGAFGVALERLMGNPRRLLSAILLADALVNLPLIILCLFLLRSVVSPGLPFWVPALLIFTVVVFACDLVPKVVALAHPYRVAKAGVRVLGVLMPVFDPAVRHLQTWSESVADAITPEKLKKGNFLSEEELETLVELSTEEGTLHETESEMIQEIIKLGDKTARDCMTPRVDAFAVPDDLTHEELIPRLRTGRHRLVPVYGETPDDILGVLEVRPFLLNPGTHYTESLLPASFVPETMDAIALLRAFLTRPQGLAVVVDEHGGTEGVITLDDLVEEIISDAVPRAEHGLYIESISEGRILVNGSARLDDINEMLGATFEEEGIDTIGGLIFNRVGTLPKPGMEVVVDHYALIVRRTSRKRIEEVLIEYRRSTSPRKPGEDE